MKIQFLKKLAISSVVIITLIGCTDKSIATKEVEQYFQAEGTKSVVHNKTIEIEVVGSKLIEKQKQKLGENWVSSEPISSVGAFIAFKEIGHSNISKPDTIVLSIKEEGRAQTYSYSYEHLTQVNEFLKICQEFGNTKNKTNFDSVYHFLGERILQTASKSQIQDFLNSNFLDEEVKKTELVGFKIAGGTATLYVDYYYTSGPQTYAITFALGGDKKIEGITLGR